MPKGPSSIPSNLQRLGPAMLAVGLPLLAFVLRVYPGVGDRQGTGDAIEYQLVGRILGIPHEPGYPQYVLLSHLWSYLPLPVTLATRINLLSALFTAVAGLFFFSTARSLSGDARAAILATWFVLLTPSVWLLSTQAEVYTLNLMWVAAVLWVALNWYDTGRQGYLLALFFFYALSFGNHLAMITLLPGLVFLVLARDPKVVLRWQTWIWATLAILTGFLQYGLLLWRSYNPHPALLSRFPMQTDAGELLDYITGGHFVDRHMLKSGLEGWLPRVWEALAHSAWQLTLPFALICGLGAYLSWRQDRVRTLFLGLIAASVVAFAAAYGIKDSLLYTMPAWFCAAMLGAVGLGWIFETFPKRRLQIGVLTAIILVALIAWRGSRLQVIDNPTDLESVIAAAEPGSGILAAFKPRRARLLRLYYRYGQVTEKAFQVDFHSVNEVLATGLEDVQDQPLYFRDPRAARKLDDSHIDFSLLRTLENGQNLYLNVPVEPLRTLELRPLWNGSLAVTMRDRSFDLLGDEVLHLFLVSEKHARSKGYLVLDTRNDSDWSRQLVSALAVASPGDRFLLVASGISDDAGAALTAVLEFQPIDLGSWPNPDRHTIVWWRVGGRPEDALLKTDPSEPLALALDLPASTLDERTTVN